MFQIDIKNRTPIYEQVIDNFKRLITTGVLRENDKVPSVRDLAQTLTINPNTVQKAYRELESRGYFYTVSGQGNFIAAPPGGESRVAVNALYGKLDETVRELRYHGEDKKDIVQHIERMRQQW